MCPQRINLLHVSQPASSEATTINAAYGFALLVGLASWTRPPRQKIAFTENFSKSLLIDDYRETVASQLPLDYSSQPKSIARINFNRTRVFQSFFAKGSVDPQQMRHPREMHHFNRVINNCQSMHDVSGKALPDDKQEQGVMDRDACAVRKPTFAYLV